MKFIIFKSLQIYTIKKSKLFKNNVKDMMIYNNK